MKRFDYEACKNLLRSHKPNVDDYLYYGEATALGGTVLIDIDSSSRPKKNGTVRPKDPSYAEPATQAAAAAAAAVTSSASRGAGEAATAAAAAKEAAVGPAGPKVATHNRFEGLKCKQRISQGDEGIQGPRGPQGLKASTLNEQ
jgi:hypothetical protein